MEAGFIAGCFGNWYHFIVVYEPFSGEAVGAGKEEC